MQIQRIPVRGTNCYLVRGDAGAILVDPGPPGGAGKVLAGLDSARVSPQQIRLIVATHGHLDHYGCAPEVQAWCGAPVAAFRGEPAFSQDRRNALPPAQTLRGSIVRWVFLLLSPLVRFRPLEAAVLLDADTDLAAYGLDARVMHIPGHSPGSLALITAGGDLLVGDLFVNFAVPSQPVYLSDRHAWKRSCERVRALAPRMVYVGHGEPFPGDRLKHIYSARYQFRWWVR